MSLHDQISGVMDRFNFDKVHKVMTFLNWTWASSDGVPSIEELKSCAYYCLSQTVMEFEKHGCLPNGMNVSTGGFEATINVFQSGTTQLQLLFYVDCIHTY